jgi:AdoMet-dependent heme synthase
MTDPLTVPEPAGAHPPASPPHASRFRSDFSDAPFIVIWEVTRACALACLHCRADAIPRRHPFELSTGDGIRLIDQVRAFGDPPPLFVLTGGDPMRRPDLAELVGHAARRGLTVALTPSGTAAATRRRLAELRDAGLSRVAVSLDGPDAATHDAFRRVRGSYGWTMKIIDAVIELGLPLQINTTVGRLTYPHVEAIASRVKALPVSLWAVFFLIATGRGAALESISARECEQLLHDLHDMAADVPFGIKTTEAPHFFRVAAERRREGVSRPAPSPVAALRAPRSVNDGNGFVFIDHLGQICPSGFLPLARGNVRRDDLAAVYRHDDLFRRLRDPDALEGRCGRCEFRSICGGSRSRAYAATGSPFGADPLCAFEPATAPSAYPA